MVWSGDPTADPITQGNIATRFVSTFGLQQEALALQSGINTVLKGVNSLLGEDSTYSTDSEGNKVSEYSSNQKHVKLKTFHVYRNIFILNHHFFN